jgi:hypothetical protein
MCCYVGAGGELPADPRHAALLAAALTLRIARIRTMLTSGA